MITNDGSNDEKGVGQKVRILGILVLVAVLSYEMGLSRGRAEKSAGEYAARNRPAQRWIQSRLGYESGSGEIRDRDG